MKHLQLATLFFLGLMKVCAFGQGNTAADAMVRLNGPASSWMRQCECAFALSIGVPEHRLRAWVPGFEWPALPGEIAPLMSGDPSKLEQLVPLLKDNRATGLNGADLAGRPDKDTFLKVSDLADTLACWLVPLGGSPDDIDESRVLEVLANQTGPWAKKAASLKPEERLAAWFEAAADVQRRMALALFIATDHASAWPVVEQNLLKRAETDEEPAYVILEAAAYVRHRKHEAAGFLQKFSDLLKNDENSRTFDALFAAKDGRFMLVESLTPTERVQQFIDGVLTIDELSEWAIRGIDQPWAYHSMGIEPASVHLKHVDRCLEAALTGAANTDDLGKRLDLLEFAEGLSDTRNDISRHSRKDELRPIPAPTEASQAKLTAALATVLADKREAFVFQRLLSPAHVAAQCVWSRWGTNTRHLDTLFHGVAADWRGRAHGFPGELPELPVDAARDLLSSAGPMKPESFPKDEAQKLATSLVNVNADEWRAQMGALSWQQKLMLCEQALSDNAFARNVWPRMRRWQTLQKSPDAPESIQKLWKEACESKPLNAASFNVLKDWLQQEAATGRHWAIVAESTACSDGLTLHVCPAYKLKQTAKPRLRLSLEGTDVFSMREEMQFDGRQWQPVKLPYQSQGPSIEQVLNQLDRYLPITETKAQVGLLRLVIAAADPAE